MNDLVELEEHIRSQTKVPSEKRSSVESHHDVQGLMNVVERDLKGKRELSIFVHLCNTKIYTKHHYCPYDHAIFYSRISVIS